MLDTYKEQAKKKMRFHKNLNGCRKIRICSWNFNPLLVDVVICASYQYAG